MLRITLSREKIYSSGRKAVSDFLTKLQVYKSTADYESANELYERYTTVNEQFQKWRDIVLLNKQPRLILIQTNTEIIDEKVHMKQYKACADGFIESWRERYAHADELQKIMLSKWESDKKHFE